MGIGARRWMLLAFGFCVYFWSLMPGVGFEPDTAKFGYIPSVLGIGHPPGYPFYMFLGFLWSSLPFPSTAYAMNLLSVVFALAALLALDDILERLKIDAWVALPTLLATALTFRLWSYAVAAEVYAPHLFILAMLLRAAMLFAQGPSPRGLTWVFVWVGLGFGHHLLIVTAVPGVAIYLLHADPHLLRRTWFWKRALLAPLLVLAAYFLLWLKNYISPIYVENQANTIGGFFDLLFARRFQSAMFIFSWEELVEERFPMFASILREEWPLPFVLSALFGAVSLYRRERWIGSMILLAILGNVAFAVQYSIGDVDVYLLPSTFLLAVLIAEGWQSVVRGLGQITAWSPAGYRIALLSLPMAALVWFLQVNEPWYARHEIGGQIDRYHAIIRALPDGAAFITNDMFEEHFTRGLLHNDPQYRGRDIRILSSALKSSEIVEAAQRKGTLLSRARPVDMSQRTLYLASDFAGWRACGLDLEPVLLKRQASVAGTLADKIAALGPRRIVLLGLVVPNTPVALRRRLIEELRGLGLGGFPSMPGQRYAAVGAPDLPAGRCKERHAKDFARVLLLPGDWLGPHRIGCLLEVATSADTEGVAYVEFLTPFKERRFRKPGLHALVVEPHSGRICDLWHVPFEEPFATHRIQLQKVTGTHPSDRLHPLD